MNAGQHEGQDELGDGQHGVEVQPAQDIAEVVQLHRGQGQVAGEEEEGAQAQHQQRAVALERVHALLERDVGDGAVDPFLGGQEGEEVQGRADDDEDQGDGGERGLEVGARLDQRGHEDAEGGADQQRADHPGGAEFGALPRVLGHGAGQRAVGDVDQAVGQAQGGVRDVGVEQGAGFAELRDGEGGHAQQQQRDGAEHDERAELAEPLAEVTGPPRGRRRRRRRRRRSAPPAAGCRRPRPRSRPRPCSTRAGTSWRW